MEDLIDKSKEKKAEQASKRDRDRDLSDIRFIVKSPEGRRFYWRVLEVGRIFNVDFSGDVNWLIFQTGEKNVSATFMQDLLEAKPEAFTQMQQENLSEQKSRENKEKDEAQNKEII